MFHQVPRQVRTQVPPASMPPMQAFFEQKRFGRLEESMKRIQQKNRCFVFFEGKGKL